MNAGLDGSNAGTALRASLLALNNPAKAQAKIMEGLGFSLTDSSGEAKSLSQIVGDLTASMEGMTEADKVATLAKLVGTEAVSGFLALTKAGPAEIDKMTASLENSAGASQEAADKMKAGIGGALEQLSGAVESFALSIGDKLAPYVQKLAEWLANVDTQPLINGFTAIVDGIAAFGAKFEEVKSSLGGEGGILSSLGISPDTVSAIVGLLGTLKENFSIVLGGIKTVVKDVFGFVKEYIMPLVGEVVTFVVEKMAEMAKFWDANGEQILQAVKNVWNGIKAVIDFVMPAVLFVIKMVWENIKGVINGALKIITGLVKVFAGLFTGDFSKMWEGVKDIFFGAIEFVWNLFNLLLYGRLLKAGAALFKGLKALFTGGWAAIKSNATTFFNWIKSFADSSFTSMRTAIFNAMAKVVTTIKTGWDEALAFLKGIDLKQIGTDVISGFISGMKSMLGNVKGFITDLASQIPDWAKKVLGIASPSKVFAKIGMWTATGLIDGMKGEVSAVERMATQLAEASIATLSGTGGYSIAGYKTPSTSAGVRSTSLATGTASAKAGGVTQHVTINSAVALSPAEIARKQKQAAQQLAMEWR